MTHILNAERRGPAPMGEVQLALGVTPGGGRGNRTNIKMQVVHVLKCDACGHECHNLPIPDHETYVPDGWANYPNGTHKCPDCRTARALEKDAKYRAALIKQGVTVEQMRSLMAVFHGLPEG